MHGINCDTTNFNIKITFSEGPSKWPLPELWQEAEVNANCNKYRGSSSAVLFPTLVGTQCEMIIIHFEYGFGCFQGLDLEVCSMSCGPRAPSQWQCDGYSVATLLQHPGFSNHRISPLWVELSRVCSQMVAHGGLVARAGESSSCKPSLAADPGWHLSSMPLVGMWNCPGLPCLRAVCLWNMTPICILEDWTGIFT